MPQLTPEKRFLAYSPIFGVIIGLAISAILAAIAIPNPSDYLLTIQEHGDFTILAARLGQSQTWMIAGVAASILYLLLLLPVLNPQINMRLRHQPGKLLRLGIFILASLLLTIGLTSRLDSFFGNMDTTLFIKISGVAIPVVWWSILGEIGVAGDLSSWTPQKPAIRTCILLAISAYLLFIVLQLANTWGFTWFSSLVSEVFAGTGESSLAGFNWLRGGIVVLSVCTSITASTIIIGLAPIKISPHERTNKLILPLGLTIGFTLFLTGSYYFGVMSYDLGKQTLAEAVGAEQTTPLATHTAILRGETIVSQPWPSEITPSCRVNCSPLPVSSANIDLLEQYLTDHPRSVHRYSAEDAIVQSWFHLWQSKEATSNQLRTQNDIIQRIVLLNRLSCLPVTIDNRNLLGDYEDDSKWWVGSKSALLLARASLHFNEFTKARHWLDVARQNGAPAAALDAITIPRESRLVNGVIAGTIQSNRPVMVGLFRGGDADIDVVLDTTYLSLNLVDSRVIDGSAPFSFADIGAGQYFLALKYDGDAAEIAMNPIRGIELDRQRDAVDVGTIELK
ncbi:MAG: hypothetical protein PF442_13595 [Desulfobulbaceae bacterium]|jgi:hypothetical protein|nr:hypothetical protein [Desulfobulbaceae bacterium]